MKKNLLLISWLCFAHSLLFAQETFNMMFYNVLDYPNLGPASRIDNLEYILQDYQPDMVMICELNEEVGADDQADRLQMVNDLMSYPDTLPSDELVMLAGDLNLYTDNEATHEELTDNTNNIYFTVPVNRVGTWTTNLSFLHVFTQSRRTQAGMGGATGGFDDSFDFLLTSPNLLTDPRLSYVVDSYKAYGNNGNTNGYNQAINSSDCSGSDFDQVLRENLFMFSDHLPATMQLSTNEALLGTKEVEIEENFRILGSNIVRDHLNLEFGQSMNFAEKLVIYNSRPKNAVCGCGQFKPNQPGCVKLVERCILYPNLWKYSGFIEIHQELT